MEGSIQVKTDEIINRVTRRSIDVNLEDINYECYGGLYSQLLYGESFKEYVDIDCLGLQGRDRLAVFLDENEDGRFILLGLRHGQCFRRPCGPPLQFAQLKVTPEVHYVDCLLLEPRQGYLPWFQGQVKFFY